jgi:hypothetical protein
MKKIVLGAVVAAMLMLVPSVFAVPALQLYIDGATYDAGTQTWVTSASSFDLYVIGLAGQNDVLVSMALDGGPDGCSVDVNGSNYNTFTYGFPPLANDPSIHDGGEDLSPHGIFPAWYTEFSAGSYGDVGKIGDVPEGTWDPTDGYLPGAGGQRGEFRKFTINVNGDCGVHFDAYTLNEDGTVKSFAPFSHDAERTPGVPEPATMLLFGLGLAGASITRRFKK